MSVINTIITSREEILAICREIVAKEGIPSVNMRMAAKKCGVSVGTIYNYFPSKMELIAAIVQEVWEDIFSGGEDWAAADCFAECVTRIFTDVRTGMERYPDFFFMHSMRFSRNEKEQGRSRMEQYFAQIRNGMMEALQHDSRVRADAFPETFTDEMFIDFVFNNLLMLFETQTDTCAVLTEIIRRTIY